MTQIDNPMRLDISMLYDKQDKLNTLVMRVIPNESKECLVEWKYLLKELKEALSQKHW